MHVTGIDPRDQTWEIDRPRYRVYFQDDRGTEWEYEIADADVDEVLAWARQSRGERSFVLFACVPRDGLGLLRLAGGTPDSPLRD